MPWFCAHTLRARGALCWCRDGDGLVDAIAPNGVPLVMWNRHPSWPTSYVSVGRDPYAGAVHAVDLVRLLTAAVS